MRNVSLVRLTGPTVAVVLGLAACFQADDVKGNSPAVAATTVAQPQQRPNHCGRLLPSVDAPVRC